MNIRELLESNSSASSSGGIKGGRKKMTKNHQHSIPNMFSYPETPSHYYAMYRFGVHMAGSPDDQEFDPAGPASNELATVAYSKGDEEIINKSRKALGFNKKRMTTNGSVESDDVGKLSPVAQWNKRK